MLLGVSVGMPEPVCTSSNKGTGTSSAVVQEGVGVGGVAQEVVAAGCGQHDPASVRSDLIRVKIIQTRTMLELEVTSVRLEQERSKFSSEALLLEEMLLLLLVLLLLQLLLSQTLFRSNKFVQVSSWAEKLMPYDDINITGVCVFEVNGNGKFLTLSFFFSYCENYMAHESAN